MSKTYVFLSSCQAPIEADPVAVPTSVDRAMRVRFDIPVTGYLCCAELESSSDCLVGVVYRESRGRFRDGTTIRTSSLKRRFESEGYQLFETLNGSFYVICGWAHPGSNPRFSGVRH